MEWMININKLIPEQRYFFENEFDATNGDRNNHWIQGPVGSGKTVVLVHTINKIFESNPRIKACIVVFTYALIDMLRTGLSEAIKSRIPIFTYPEFSRTTDNYDIIFVDEVQDIRADVLSHLRNYSNQLIVAGDSVQSIYDDGCPPYQISQLTNTKPYQLRTVHRLTNKIIQIASNFLDDPDLLLSAPRGRLANVDVVKYVSENISEEVRFVYSKAKEFAEQGYSTAILLPKHTEITKFLDEVCAIEEIDYYDWPAPHRGRNASQEYEGFNSYVSSMGFPIQYLGNSFGSLQRAYDENLINVMTYHSSKGLDFQAVFLPFLSDSLEIWRNDPLREKTLFFVALTRSRQNLFLSYSDDPHHLMLRIPAELLMLEGTDNDFGSGDDSEDDFLYNKDDLPF
ncbi:MAG: hypothetical protein IPM14_05185 [bacterium]|nr:hypothetical protein [bacterium]